MPLSSFIGDISGRASPLTSIPDELKPFVEHSIGLRVCLDTESLLREGVSRTDSIGLIGDMFGLEMVLVVELLCLEYIGVDRSDTGLDVIKIGLFGLFKMDL